jgi:nitrite transporter NirC
VPGPVPRSVTDVANLAATKAESLRRLPRYAAATTFAGACVGAAVVLSARTAGPLSGGVVLGIALTLIAFAGAELFTFNTMIMALGWLRGHVTPGEAILVNLVSLLGNIAGAIGFSALIHSCGVLPPHATISTPNGPLFWRAVVCTMLVCLALWMATRATSHSATYVMLFWAVLAFVAAGVEHPIANVTIFSLAIFQGTAHWSALADDLLLTVPGIIVGGAVLLALPYLPVGRGRETA